MVPSNHRHARMGVGVVYLGSVELVRRLMTSLSQQTLRTMLGQKRPAI